MIHTKTLGNKVGPSIIYQNKTLQVLEFKLLSNNSVFPETTSSSTTTTSTTTLKSCKTEDNKRRLVYSLKMSEEFKDPAIKLFGKTISLPQNDFFSGDYDDQGSQTSSNAAVYRDNKNTSGEEEFATCENNEVESSNLDDEEKEEDAEDSEEKTLKKPDKILPCPRCNSMDTKFCYFNNYNVNQPRHFCKNCQRYWTAGGTMRNVPVGSGRRKNKSACSSQYRHAMGPTDHGLKPNGTVLTFGPDNPLCESMSSALDLAERSSSNSNATEGFVPVQHAPPHFPTPQWPYQFPTAFYPAPQYWGCVAPGPWNMPWPHHLQPQPDVGYASPTLGKHDRDGGNGQNDPERTILVPKTLRIDDPKEAAKSSIWSTLGIKNECISGERLFKAAFPAGKGKGNSEMDVDETSLVMQANPAAFSRSQCFHESS